jgi:hypothetical protein
MMKIPYPLSLDDQRSYPEGFAGNVFVWDIDKTYLETHFSSLKGMARIPVEFAIDKQAIAGMPEIIRGLRRGPGEDFACAPLYFVSASPPQMRKVIERKMLMDGVEYDGIILKDWLKTLRQLRPGRLREQAGFKICALLAGRLNRPGSVEYLFGDDVESDAEAFFIYARLLSGDLPAGQSEQKMVAAGIRKDDRNCIRALLDRLGPDRGRVERAFIHLERNTPPERFADLAPEVVPVKGSVQLSLALYGSDLVDAETVRGAIASVKASPASFDTKALVADAQKRKLISKKKLKELEIPEGE